MKTAGDQPLCGACARSPAARLDQEGSKSSRSVESCRRRHDSQPKTTAHLRCANPLSRARRIETEDWALGREHRWTRHRHRGGKGYPPPLSKATKKNGSRFIPSGISDFLSLGLLPSRALALPLDACVLWARPPCWQTMSAFTSTHGGMRLLSARSRPRRRPLDPEDVGD